MIFCGAQEHLVAPFGFCILAVQGRSLMSNSGSIPGLKPGRQDLDNAEAILLKELDYGKRSFVEHGGMSTEEIRVLLASKFEKRAK